MTPLPWPIELLLALLIVTGALFTLIGGIGLIRFSTFFQRLHAPTKASTLGLGALLIASMIVAWLRGDPGFAELLVTLFIFLTAPVSAAMLAQAALRRWREEGTRAADPKLLLDRLIPPHDLR